MRKPQMRLRRPKTKKEQAALYREYGVHLPRRGEITFPQPSKENENGQAPINPTPPETTR